MANSAPQAVAAPSAKPRVASPPTPPVESAAEEAPEEVTEEAPQVERVNMSGLILEKTVYSDGECETEVLKEPMIRSELVRATRKLQQARGY